MPFVGGTKIEQSKKLYGTIGAIARNLQTMVFADTVEKLMQAEETMKKKLDELKTDRHRDASTRKSDVQKLYNDLRAVSDTAFVALKVFTGGTLSNSYAESINNSLRKSGLIAFGTSRIDSIFALRKYCQASLHSITQCSRERQQKLEIYMQPDVIKFVSNGVLRHQAEQLDQAEENTRCKIVAVQEEGQLSKYTVEEKITKHINKNWVLSKTVIRGVKWNRETDTIECSCNALTYRGMPCIHISRVAIEKKNIISR